MPATKTELHRIEWDHPRLGKVSETVCRWHEAEVMAALRTLGIGSGGSMEWDDSAQCHRCSHPKRMRVRAWLEEALASERPGILDDRQLTKLERRIAEVADATGKRVVIGRQGHKDEWFAHCDGIEWAGSTALAALESVVRGLADRGRNAAREAQIAAQQASRLEAL